jgi:signal transduction histidine kinase
MFDRDTAAVFDALPGAVIAVDDEEHLVTGNPQSSVAFGRDVDTLTGRTLADLADAGFTTRGTCQRYRAALASLRDDDSTQTGFTAKMRRAGEGPAYTYDVDVSTYEADGEFRGTFWSLTEMSTRQRYDETVDALHRATRDLMTAETRTEVYSLCGVAANDVLGFPGTGVREYDPDDGRLHHVSFGGRVDDIDARPPYEVDDSPHGEAFRSGETVVDEIPDEGDPYERDVFSYTMYVPIGEYGVLSLGKFGDRFDETDVRFAEILAQNTAAAITQVEQTQALRRQRTALERQNERLDQFASVLSHDLRNPLNVAQGAVDRLEDVDPAVRDDLEYAHGRMSEIIEEVLALAREGDDVEDPTSVAFGDAARTAWEAVDTADLDLQVAADGRLLADEQRLRRLLENCFRNSVEHGGDADAASTDGGADLTTVRVGVREHGFFVADDGVGIDEPDRVFDHGYTTSEDGTGFGLAIVAELAAAHGWTVDASESETGGARFEFGDVTRMAD